MQRGYDGGNERAGKAAPRKHRERRSALPRPDGKMVLESAAAGQGMKDLGQGGLRTRLHLGNLPDLSPTVRFFRCYFPVFVEAVNDLQGRTSFNIPTDRVTRVVAREFRFWAKRAKQNRTRSFRPFGGPTGRPARGY